MPNQRPSRESPFTPSGGLEISAIVGLIATKAKEEVSLLRLRMAFFNSRFMKLAQGAQFFATLAMMLQMTAFRNHMIHQMQVSRAMMLENAQKRYIETVNTYGATSKEAQIAQRELGIVRNQEGIMQQRIRILQEQQMMMFMGIGMQGFMQLGSLYATWGNQNQAVATMRSINNTTTLAKNEALTTKRSAELVGAAASAPGFVAADILTGGVGIFPVAEVDPITQASTATDQVILNMHAGGVVATSGFRYLQAGESVNPQRGWDRPQVHTLVIKPIPGTPSKEIARDFFERVNRLKGN